MAIASFSNKIFSINSNKIYTFSDLQYSTNYETEAQDVEGKKPSTYKKGSGLNAMSFSIKLDASFKVNPRKEITDWENIKASGTPYPFILGNKSLGSNKWLLKDVSVSDMNIDNAGKILSATLNLKFEEYVRPGSKSNSSSSKKAKKSAGVKTSVKVDPKLLMPTTDEKATAKRTNVIMDEAVARKLHKTALR